MAFLRGGDPDKNRDNSEPTPIREGFYDFRACVLCMMSYESQFGRPVDGEDYDSNRLEICEHHIKLLMMAHDAELDLMRAQVDMAYARYRPPHSPAGW